MNGVLIIYRRELAGLFLAPLAWILLCATLLYCAFFFLAALEQYGGEVNAAFTYMHSSPFWFLVVFLPPLLTMRMISEESKSGLLEFLLTAPVGDAAVVCGKLLAATTFLGIAWSFVLVYGVVVHALGAPPDWGQLAMQWFGAVLVCALASGIGLMSSAISGTPLLAAFFAILANIVLLVLPLTARWVRGPLRSVMEWFIDKVNVTGHYQGSFLSGALDTGDLSFFLTWTLVALFCAIRIVESEEVDGMKAFGRLSRASIGLRTLFAAILAVGGGVLLVYLAGEYYLRWDLSVSRRNTLDESILDVLDNLEEPVEVDVFVRPLAQPYDRVCIEVAERLMQVLAVARGARRGQLEVNVHDVNDLEQTQARQRELGVEGVNLVVFSNASGTQRSVQNLLGDIAVIDWGQPTVEGLRYLAQNGIVVANNLGPTRPGTFRHAQVASFRGEEVFAQALLKVSSGAQPRAYFSTGQGEPALTGADPGDHSRLKAILEQDGFEVLAWNPATRPGVPSDADVVALVGATQAFPPGTLEALDEYVDDGGRVIAAPSLGEVERGDEGGIAEFLRNQGMIAQPGIVCEPIIGMSGQKLWNAPECANLLIIETGLSASHPLTEPLRRRARHLRFLQTISFRRGALETGGVLLDLVNSSSESWLDLPLAPGRYDYRFDSRQERRERRRLAMLAEYASSLRVGESAVQRGRVLGVAGSTFFSNALMVDNRDFLLNAFNWMAERDYRIRVSPIPRSESRLDLARSQALPTLGWLFYLGLPGACVGMGLLLAWRRRS